MKVSQLLLQLIAANRPVHKIIASEYSRLSSLPAARGVRVTEGVDRQLYSQAKKIGDVWPRIRPTLREGLWDRLGILEFLKWRQQRKSAMK